MDALERKAVGALAGAAVGDALGGATEGWSPEKIRERHNGPVTGIVGPFLPDWREARPASPYHKGDGHVTDDTLMTNLLVRVYQDKRDHLDAYDVAERLVPLINGEVVWIPELERSTVPLIRLFLAEKWLVTRLHYGHIDPREAGVGNVVNCGAAMYSAPIGIVNAADPAGAYAEAIEVAGAHQSSYGREAAGVFAAAVAAAFAPGASVAGVVDTALSLAHDGTRAAIEAVCERASKLAATGVSTLDAAAPLREAMEPFDTVGPEYRDPGLGARRAEPAALHRGAAARARHARARRRRLPAGGARRRELRPRLRLDRHHGRGDRRGAARRRGRACRVGRGGRHGQPARSFGERPGDGRGRP